MFDVNAIRVQFPILQRAVNGQPLIYLDNANTSHKPASVIACINEFYSTHNANVARAVHTLGEEATLLHEATRVKLATFLGAKNKQEIVYTSGTTHAINLVAHSFVRPRLRQGDSVLITQMEHHANIVPWQLACDQAGATLKVVPILPSGELDMAALTLMLTPDVKLLSVTHVSNALGTINPVSDICALAREKNIPVLIDGSQAVPHFPVNISDIGCDFYAITGHKIFGPTGTGALWARYEHLQAMPPFFGGGEMIKTVTFDKTTYADAPTKFEAGTPNIAGFVGLGAALDFMRTIDWAAAKQHEHMLLNQMRDGLKNIAGLRILGNSANMVPVISFVVDGAHAHDVAMLLDTHGIAIRSGHHCAHPLMQFYDVPAACRASLSIYNTASEVDFFVAKLRQVIAQLR
jgi:cysteine desulfurase / selenocysteine lyase